MANSKDQHTTAAAHIRFFNNSRGGVYVWDKDSGTTRRATDQDGRFICKGGWTDHAEETFSKIEGPFIGLAKRILDGEQITEHGLISNYFALRNARAWHQQRGRRPPGREKPEGVYPDKVSREKQDKLAEEMGVGVWIEESSSPMELEEESSSRSMQDTSEDRPAPPDSEPFGRRMSGQLDVYERWRQQRDGLQGVKWGSMRFDKPCLVLPDQCRVLYLPLSPTVLLLGGAEGERRAPDQTGFILNLLAHSARSWLVATSESALVEAFQDPSIP